MNVFIFDNMFPKSNGFVAMPITNCMAIFALKQTVDFYGNQDTPVYMCSLDAKKSHLIELIVGHKQETVRQRCAISYCEIVYLLHREQEFMVR